MSKRYAKKARPAAVGRPMSEEAKAELHGIWVRKYAPVKKDHDEYASKVIRGRVGGN